VSIEKQVVLSSPTSWIWGDRGITLKITGKNGSSIPGHKTASRSFARVRIHRNAQQQRSRRSYRRPGWQRRGRATAHGERSPARKPSAPAGFAAGGPAVATTIAGMLARPREPRWYTLGAALFRIFQKCDEERTGQGGPSSAAVSVRKESDCGQLTPPEWQPQPGVHFGD